MPLRILSLRPRPHWAYIALLVVVAATLVMAHRYVVPRLSSVNTLPGNVQDLPASAVAGVAWPAGGAQWVVEVLGNPAAFRYPDCVTATARNPWDLIVHAGKLYIGLGNASNDGPFPNAGPVPVQVYDPGRRRFIRETVLPDEEIRRFYRINDELLIPGTDPKQSWHWGNLYQRGEVGVWTQCRTLPRTIHAYALAQWDGHLVAATSITDALPKEVGEARHGSAVAMSDDGGRTWRLHPLAGLRTFDLLQVDGHLYTVDVFPGAALRRWLKANGRESYHVPIHEYGRDGRFHPRPDLRAETLFPTTAEAGQLSVIVEQAVSWGRVAIYIGAHSAKDGALPIRGLYIAENLAPGRVSARRVILPAGAIAWDVRVENGEVEVLFGLPLPDGHWRNAVWRSQDGENWEERLAFEAVTFARSFERLGEDYYFGLGMLTATDTQVPACTAAAAATGTLLRVLPNRPLKGDKPREH